MLQRLTILNTNYFIIHSI